MKKFNLIFTILLTLGFAGAASAASLSWVSTQSGSSVTDSNGSEIAVQYGFGHAVSSFTHSYSYQTDQPTQPSTAFYIELLNEYINVTSITLDGAAMLFDAKEARWHATTTLQQAVHDIVISGNVERRGQQYNVFVETPEVPVPAAVWLFGSGLLGLIGLSRKKSAFTA